nr:MAG TPA: minor capsid protein [Caudoviricetes sp.]
METSADRKIKLNDQQLTLDASQVSDLYHKLTLELFDQVVDRLRERGSVSLAENPYIWQLEKMNQMGLLNTDNVKLIAEYSGIAEKQLRHIIEGEGYKVYKTTRDQLAETLGADDLDDNPEIQNNLASYANQALGDVNNLINSTLPESVRSVFQSVIEESVGKVVTGIATPERALNDTIMKWFEKGFYGFTDSQGKRWRADSYARTVIKSTVKRAFREMRTAPAKEFDIDTFYFSKKATAREACAPLQHQIVTYGPQREENGITILSMADHGYGTPAGCLGINCGHDITPFVVGFNELPDLGPDVKDISPSEAIANANAQAKQRALERSIRNSKEKLHVANKLGDKELISKYKSKIRTQQSAMRDFLKDKPFLHRDYAREKLFKKNEKPASVEPAGNKSYISVKDKWLSNVDPSKTKVTEMNSWEHNGQKYQVDGKHVVLDYSQKEKEVGEWLSKTFGKHVKMAPRVNFPEKIPSPDYLVDGLKFDLKEITGSGKGVVDGNLRKTKQQSENIVFDVTRTKLSNDEILSQLEKVYDLNRRGLSIAIIKDGEELIDILKLNKK